MDASCSNGTMNGPVSWEPGQVGRRLRVLRARAVRRPEEWVEDNMPQGLALSWRVGAEDEELALHRPCSVVFEQDLRMVVDAASRHLGLEVVRRRVLGHAIHMTLRGVGAA